MKSLLVLLSLAAPLLQDKKGPPKIDQAKVDGAIHRGVEYLKSQIGKYGSINKRRSEELILWTFAHAGVPESDPDFEKLLKTVTETPLEWTYNVSLQAMILEELDRVKHQGRIQQCAQFLVDNQCKNGQWSYGEPDLFAKDTPTAGGKAVASGGGKPPRPGANPGTRTKPKVTHHVPIKQMKSGPPTGDNSNSQYAALGLRACHDAGIVLPPEVVELAEKWWRDSMKEGGWDYHKGTSGAYGSMTAGAVGALTIYLYVQGKQWMKDKEVVAGLDWLGKNFTVEKNPGNVEDTGMNGWQYYYLYAIERAAIFYITETIGGHDWYVEGAKMLLDAQKPDGSWQSKGADHAIWDTCFAILFLRRATRPLLDVASVDKKK